MHLAIGELISRDFHQRAPSIASITGRKKTLMPNTCSSKSLLRAPTMPIQLCGALLEGPGAAELNEGSAGE